MAQPWDAYDGFLTQYETTVSDDVNDDDLFSAALLFLDHHHGDSPSHSHSHSSDSDSYSTQTAETELPHASDYSTPHWKTQSYSDGDASLQVELKFPVTDPFALSNTTVFVPNEDGSSLSWPANASAVPLWSSSDAMQLPPPTLKAAAAPRRVNKRREEIKSLKVEAHILQARLHALQDRSSAGTDTRQLVAEPWMDGVMDAAWHSVASRQLEQRQRAESENRRLKDLVADHKRTAKSLRRLMARYANAKTWDPFRPAPRAHSTKTDSLSDPAIFEKLLAWLEPMLGQTSTVLPSQSDPTGQGSRHVEIKRHDAENYLTVQLVDSRIVPFSVTATAAAVWDYVLHPGAPQLPGWQRVPGNENTFQSEFAAYTDMGSFHGHVNGKMVMRLIEQPDRVVVVRSGLFHCLTAGQKNRFFRVPMRHHLWMVVSKPSLVKSNNNNDPILSKHGELCQIQTCTMAMPRLDSSEDPSDPCREAEIEDLVKTCTQVSMYQSDQAHESIDNSLLLGVPGRRSSANNWPRTAQPFSCEISKIVH